MSENTGCGVDTLSTREVIITNSTVSGNGGDGLFLDNTDMDIVNSTVSDNGGAGVFVYYLGFASVDRSTITGNSGNQKFINRTSSDKYGGGLYTGFYGSASVENSTISGNSAKAGGGIYIRSLGDCCSGSVGMRNNTITNNTATDGGGVFIGDYGRATIIHTLVTGNTAARGREVFAESNRYLAVGRFNVFGHSGNAGVRGFAPGPTDIVPNQGPNTIRSPTLANNGGPTRTHALMAGSPAVDSVNDGTCPPPGQDQRGVQRPRDGNGDGGPACDTGSFER